MAGRRTDLLVLGAGLKRWDSTSLEYLALLISVEWSTSVRSGLLGTITERGSPGMQTAVAAGEWHIRPLIFLLVLRFIPSDEEEEKDRGGYLKVSKIGESCCFYGLSNSSGQAVVNISLLSTCVFMNTITCLSPCYLPHCLILLINYHKYLCRKDLARAISYISCFKATYFILIT